MAYLLVMLAGAATLAMLALSVLSGQPLHTAFTSASPITQVFVVATAMHGSLVTGLAGARTFGPAWQDRSRLLPGLGLIALALGAGALLPELPSLAVVLDAASAVARAPELMRAALPVSVAAAVAALSFAASAPGVTARATRWR
jgi:hypothetical protein